MTPPKELWRSIPGFPEYVVSSTGRIANKNTGHLKSVNSRGRVTLHRSGWKTKRLATRIFKDVWQRKNL